MTVKCGLCKEAAFVPLPGWPVGRVPDDWRIVPIKRPLPPTLADREPFYDAPLVLCPFCIAVARALQTVDQAPPTVERTQPANCTAMPTEAKIQKTPVQCGGTRGLQTDHVQHADCRIATLIIEASKGG